MTSPGPSLPASNQLAPRLIALVSPLGHGALLLGGFGLSLLVAPHRILNVFRSGGAPFWSLLAGGLLGLLLMLVQGLWLVRRPQKGLWWLVLCPAVLMGCQSAVMARSLGRLTQLLGPASSELVPKVGGFFTVLSESLIALTVGGVVSAILLSTATLIAGARALSRVSAHRFTTLAVLVWAAGLGTLLVTPFAKLWMPALAWSFPVGLLVAFSGCLTLGIGAVTLSLRPVESGDRPAALADTLLGVAFAAGGLVLCAIVVRCFNLVLGLSAIANQTLGEAERQRLLSQLWAESRASGALHLVYGVSVLGALLVLVIGFARYVRTALALCWKSLAAVVLTLGLLVSIPLLQLQELAQCLVRAMEVRPPAGVHLVQLEQSAGSEDPFGPVLALGPERLRWEGLDLGQASQLDTPQGCEQFRQRLLQLKAGPIVIAADKSTPFFRMSCVASPEPEPAGAEPTQPPLVYWLVDAPADGHWPLAAPFDKLRLPPVVLRSRVVSRLARLLARPRVHLSPGLCLLQFRPDGPVLRFRGEPAAQRKWLRQQLTGSDGQMRSFSLTADPLLTAEEVLAAMVGPHGAETVRLGPPCDEQQAFRSGAGTTEPKP